MPATGMLLFLMKLSPSYPIESYLEFCAGSLYLSANLIGSKCFNLNALHFAMFDNCRGGVRQEP
jgi:hypothetical protein